MQNDRTVLEWPMQQGQPMAASLTVKCFHRLHKYGAISGLTPSTQKAALLIGG